MTDPGEPDLEQLHAGDAALFDRLVRTWTPRLVPYLRRYADGPADLDDLLQEVWLRAYDKRLGFSGRGSFIGWLFTIGRTVGLAARSRRGRDVVTGTPPDPPAAGSPDAALLGAELREAVLGLPERQREVVLLRLVDGLSTRDAARRLGCAEGTVKATLHQATRKLRELLNGWYP